jgi:hypothetical protein
VACSTLDIDVPLNLELEARSQLVDCMVRIAEALRESDDTYHQVYRQPSESETVVVTVGARIQALGERMALALGRPTLQARTVLWLALSRQHAVGEVLGPVDYDPEDGGEPERLLSDPRVRWAAAMCFVHRGAAGLFRTIVYVPRSAREEVDRSFFRLRERLPPRGDCGGIGS